MISHQDKIIVEIQSLKDYIDGRFNVVEVKLDILKKKVCGLNCRAKNLFYFNPPD